MKLCERERHLKVSFKLPFENGIFFLQLLESPHASAYVHAKPLSNEKIYSPLDLISCILVIYIYIVSQIYF